LGTTGSVLSTDRETVLKAMHECFSFVIDLSTRKRGQNKLIYEEVTLSIGSV